MVNKLLVFISYLLLNLINCYIDRKTYDEIKSKATFELLEYEEVKAIFGNKTREEIKIQNGENYSSSPEMLLHLNDEPEKTFLERERDPNVNQIVLPQEYDIRKTRPECLTPIKNQGECGSCYTFSTSGALETRYCLKSGGKLRPELSQSDMLSCDTKNLKCQGSTLFSTWRHLEYYGTCDYKCKPYQSAFGYIPKCSSTCNTSSLSYYKWRAKPGTYKSFSDILLIKNEIYTNGPVTTGMQTFEDLYTYKSGVYVHSSGKRTDDHAVAIIGWGYDNTYRQEYWVIRNSWGADWGENGYFKVLFGMYGVTDLVCASLPLI